MPPFFYIMETEQQLINALIEKPSTYDIDVIDTSMLPQNLKRRKTISFTVKPPTLEVLAKCVVPLFNIPKEIREAEELALDEAIKHRKEMAEVVAILAHGKQTEHPSWYADFILSNITPKELYNLFYEISLKLQSDFFLNSLKIVSQSNPMQMNT